MTTRYVPRGTLIGRYVVVDWVGEGGMGVVYRAFDPELDRMVALKLLQVRPAAHASVGDQAWLLREAQALARLAHPNVVVVHDVGLYADDQVFVAMELVDGDTLRTWLEKRRRTWREIQAVMVEAGAGLAAAHAAGLVHRDFKPDNVIVGAGTGANAGRVRVMDFGLARLQHDDELRTTSVRDPDIAALSPRSTELTVVDGVIGTPAYMAPELFDGVVAEARADQFSFGVVLYEALCGERPFAKLALIPDRKTPRPVVPADAKVPAALVAVVLRAIAVDPAERYPSMDALIAELAIDPLARRRRVRVGVGGAVAIAGAVGVTIWIAPGSHSEVCKGADKRLTGVWDAAAKQHISAAYAATKVPTATAAFAALDKALDGYAHDWTAASIESCEATRIRRDQTEEVLSLREACLDRRLEELRALTRLLATEPSRTAIEKADGVVVELEPLARCSDVEALREPAKPPPGPKSRELETQMAVAKADLIAGRYLPTLVATHKIVDAATQIGYAPIAAEAQMVGGIALLGSQNGDDALAAFGDATRTGLAARRDDIAAKCAFNAATLAAATLKQPREARIWLSVGIAVSKRAGTDPLIDLLRYSAEGIVDAENGDPLGAVVAHEQMLAIAERVKLRGEALVDVESKFATTLLHADAYARAAAMFERVLAQQLELVGPNHPYIALVQSNLGLCYGKLGDVQRARDSFGRALVLRERLFGAASPFLLPTLDNLADILKANGSVAEALPIIERAAKIAEPLGSDDSMYQTIATSHADILAAAGRFAEARAIFDPLLAVEQRTHSTVLASTLTARAELALAERAWADAAAFAERSIAELELAGGKTNPELWQPLGDLGRARLELGRTDAAREALDRALDLGGKLQLPAATLAPIRAARDRIH